MRSLSREREVPWRRREAEGKAREDGLGGVEIEKLQKPNSTSEATSEKDGARRKKGKR